MLVIVFCVKVLNCYERSILYLLHISTIVNNFLLFANWWFKHIVITCTKEFLKFQTLAFLYILQIQFHFKFYLLHIICKLILPFVCVLHCYLYLWFGIHSTTSICCSLLLPVILLDIFTLYTMLWYCDFHVVVWSELASKQ